MKRRLTIVLAAAAFVAASAMAWADTYSTLSNPRIIHVPQPGDELRRTQASLRSDTPDEFDDGDAEEAAVPQRPRRVERPAPPRVKPQAKKSKERRRPFSVSLPEPPPEPEPTGPKRALLSAPPPPTPSIHDGPTPLKPTPRFGQPLPEAPPPLTTFTPPPVPVPAAKPVAAAEPLALPLAVDDNDDHLPPPGDPKLAPPEPKD